MPGLKLNHVSKSGSWWALLRLLSRNPFMQLSLCYPLGDLAPVEWIYRCPISKTVAMTRLQDRSPIVFPVIVARMTCRADFRFGSSQWETSLQINAVFHWLGVNLESALTCHQNAAGKSGRVGSCPEWYDISTGEGPHLPIFHVRSWRQSIADYSFGGRNARRLVMFYKTAWQSGLHTDLLMLQYLLMKFRGI